MIKFDPALLTIEIVRLKSVTTSLGGSISVVDDKLSTPTKDAFKRVPVPMAITRAFIKSTNKITKYLRPVFTALVKYDNFVVAMERHPLSSLGEVEYEGVFGPTRWIPDCENNFNNIVKPLVTRGDKQWYFDGRYVYSFTAQDLGSVVRDSERLTKDGGFRKVIAQSVDMQGISSKEKIKVADRTCLAFVTTTGKGVISPPIWKNLSDVGTTQLNKSNSTDDDEDEELDDYNQPKVTNTPNMFSFDRIDQTLSVNLNFALKAGSDIGRTFGYERIEPLRLPQLMVELCTVNLPNIPTSVKNTYNIGISFTHTISWLLGMITKAKNLQEYIVIRSCLKHLTKRGIFRANVLDADRVFKGKSTVTDVPLKTLNDLIANQEFTQQSLAAILAQARTSAKYRKQESGVHSVGELLNEDD